MGNGFCYKDLSFMCTGNENSLTIKQPRYSSYGREITIALGLKFLLLGGLWWLFFAGNKQPVDEAVIAGKIYGVQSQVVISKENKERLK